MKPSAASVSLPEQMLYTAAVIMNALHGCYLEDQCDTLDMLARCEFSGFASPWKGNNNGMNNECTCMIGDINA